MDITEKYKGQISDIDQIAEDIDKASVWIENELRKAGDILGFIESLRPRRVLGSRSPRIKVGTFECVQRCNLTNISHVFVPVVSVNTHNEHKDDSSIPYCPLTQVFQSLYLITHDELSDENQLKQDAENTRIYRLISFNPEQRTITLVDSSTLKKGQETSEVRVPEDGPSAFYEGQIVSRVSETIEIGRHLKSVTLSEMKLANFEGYCMFIITCLPSSATVADVENVLLALDVHCSSLIEACPILCLSNCYPYLCEWQQLEQEWNKKHKSTLHFVGVSKREHSSDLNYFESRRLTMRFKVASGAAMANENLLPFIFTSLPILQHCAWRSSNRSLNILDAAVEDIVKCRHLLPSLWMSSNATSMHPGEVDSLVIDPYKDAIFVCPNEQKHETHLGRHGHYCGIFIPPLTVAKVKYYGLGGKRQPPWKQLAVELAGYEIVAPS